MRHAKPEPNFGRLVTVDDLKRIFISAHALRRFVERLQPAIPGADLVAQDTARLETKQSGTRTTAEQTQLARNRDWLAATVEPCVIDLIRSEGFWATNRPRWSQSRTPSDAYLQIGRLCLWPTVKDGPKLVLTTCTNGKGTTWDTALDRHYTLMPQPLNELEPQQIRRVGTVEILRRTWHSRHQHNGLLTAFRVERTNAIEMAERINGDRLSHIRAARKELEERRERAYRTFRERHADLDRR
jgi:hypothetical protein